MKNLKKNTIRLVMIALAVLSAGPVFAAINLSVLPYDGSSKLDFGRIAAERIESKEVQLRITSSENTPYEIRQRVVEPIQNDQGNRLDLSAINCYTLRGSNTSGSMYLDIPAMISPSDQVLYSSSTNGASDAFIAVYSIDPAKVNISGNLRGRILYTLMPKGAGQVQEVLLDVAIDSQGSIQVIPLTSSGATAVLSISSKDVNLGGYLKLEMRGNLSSGCRIFQQVEEPFKNQRGEKIDASFATFKVEGKNGSSRSDSFFVLDKNAQEIYSTQSAQGDEVAVNFIFDKKALVDLTAGTYRCRLTYRVESNNEVIALIPLEIQFEIQPDFSLEVSYESAQGLGFPALKPGMPKEERVINIKTISNLRKAYLVVQKVENLLTNENGNAIPEGYFKVYAQTVEGNVGTALVSSPASVVIGDTKLFMSDDSGSSSGFKVVYSLEMPRDLKGGNYAGKITYSMIEK